MQKVKQTSLADELRDHVEVGLTGKVDAHTHIKDYIGVTKLV